MKKFILIIIITVLAITKVAFSQELHTPYPIIFVHGLVGDMTTWTDNPNGLTYPPQYGEWDIVDFLGSGEEPLLSGGLINISLDFAKDNVNFNKLKENDVKVFTTTIPKKDIYLINFAVHAKAGYATNSGENSSLLLGYIPLLDEEFSVVDPWKFAVGDLISIDAEIMLVTEINGNTLTVLRGQCNTINSIHFPKQVFNLYKESNQAAVVKQGYALMKAIDKVKVATGASKVILVGHSMGGLAVREYIRSYYNSRLDIAKIVTIGTPHGGSNLAAFYDLFPTTIMGMDERSDAIRDLKSGADYDFNWLFWGNLGVYLFGGDENSIPNDYYSKDVNCNAIMDYNFGVNQFNLYPFPLDFDRNWIVSTLPQMNNDGIVFASSQYLENDEENVINTISGHTSYLANLYQTGLIGEPKNIYALMRGLDEPSEPELCYEIGLGTYKGFNTIPKDNSGIDEDLYRLQIISNGILNVSISANEFSSIQSFELLDSFLSSVSLETGINNIITHQVTDGETYYIRVTGNASTNTYLYPYLLHTSISPIVNQLTVSNSLEYYDQLVGEYSDKHFILTNNSDQNLTITNISLLEGINDFIVLTSFPFEISPQAVSNLNVRFQPLSEGSKSATIQIQNTSSQPLISRNLHGNGVSFPTRTLVITPESIYNFGNVNITYSKTKQFKLLNTGSHPVTITNIALSGLHADAYTLINTPPVPFEILTGEIISFSIQFLPLSVGSKIADLIVSNDSDNDSPDAIINLSGIGKNSNYLGIYNTITAYEYWFDDQFQTKTSVSCEPVRLKQIDLNLETSSLETGLHRVNVRFKDNTNKWSSVLTEPFFVKPIDSVENNLITQAEYWIDDSYSDKELFNITSSSDLIIGESLDYDSLATGQHYFNTRFKDTRGLYSSVLREPFYKHGPFNTIPNLISEYRYWYDDTFSPVQNQIVPTQDFILNDTVNVYPLDAGNHLIHYQFRDISGWWSSVITDTFNFQGYSISGFVKYNNLQQTPIDSARILLKLNGIIIDSALSTTDGSFLFEHQQNGTYVLEVLTTKPWNGVNSTDALKIQRHIAEMELINEPIRLMGADVNASSSINATDAVKVKRRIAGIDNNFVTGDWLFLQTTGNPFVTINGANITCQLYSLCTGDVNGSNIPD